MEHKQQNQSSDEKRLKNVLPTQTTEKKKLEEEEVAPGVPIVRSNTPRPLSYEMMISSGGQYQGTQPHDAVSATSFPTKAPSAPPLPEELGERELEENVAASTSFPIIEHQRSAEEIQEFIWLFEYGLEMDAAILNSPERLDGSALLYGPAVLKGYKLVLGAQRIHGSTGPTIVAIHPSSEPDAEVWGVLYRIPQRLSELHGNDPSLLDTIHAAIMPQKFFKGVPVVVYDTYREREITSVTYVATDIAYQQLRFTNVEPGREDDTFMQRLATIARKQKLPESYINELLGKGDQVKNDPLSADQFVDHRSPRVSSMNSSVLEESTMHHTAPDQYASRSSQVAGIQSAHIAEVRSAQMGQAMMAATPIGIEPAMHDEHNTEPLPVFADRRLPAVNQVSKALISQPAPNTYRWLIAFAIYLVLLLFIALVFAIVQGLGFGNGVLNNRFVPLGVPWMVMMYGLLGGCISSIVTLGRLRMDTPPTFIIITWFTRPFIGAILAILSYVLLTSGLFIWSESISSNHAFFLLAGALAGLCEGWIFFRRSATSPYPLSAS
jgi:hypothetical protein